MTKKTEAEMAVALAAAERRVEELTATIENLYQLLDERALALQAARAQIPGQGAASRSFAALLEANASR